MIPALRTDSGIDKVLDTASWLSPSFWRKATQEKIEAGLKSGRMLTDMDETGATPLHLACRTKNTNAVAILIEKGANTDSIDRAKKKPCEYAEQDSEISKLLATKSASKPSCSHTCGPDWADPQI